VSAPLVLVCVPAFRGATVIGETLRAIARQQVPGLACHISVDGGDAETAEACRPFLTDPRFRLTVQERRLGWAGNLNALWAEPRDGYAIYWQQDDLTDDRYLERLLAAAEAAPFASVTYADVQWFGARSEREEFPSVTGFALDRALRMAEAQHYLPFRGLVRVSALRAAGLLRITPYDSALEDLVQVVRFARVGEMLRVPGPIYLKRAHRAAVHGEHLGKPLAFRRGAALLYAAGMLAAVWPAAHGDDARRVARRLLPRFLRGAPGRWLYYDAAAENPGDLPRFATEALRAAAAACGVPSGAALLGPWPLDAEDPDQALLAEALRREAWREAFRARRWRVKLSVRAFPPAAAPRVAVVQDGAVLAEARLARRDSLTFAVEAAGEGARIMLSLPDAVSPASLGLGKDARPLSLGLMSLAMSRG
jgi:glycosyltransferase involved in cell wall biosynthesis